MCVFKVSGSKIWQMERSCNCCQESGEREATVVLFCPKAKSEDKRFRKVKFPFYVYDKGWSLQDSKLLLMVRVTIKNVFQ